MADTSLPERLGRVVGRHGTVIRCTSGLALVIAAVALLGLYLPDAFAPVRYETSAPRRHDEGFERGPRYVCYATTEEGIRFVPPGGDASDCFRVSGMDLDRILRVDVNESHRHRGKLVALASGIAVVIGWRLWRDRWKRRDPAIDRLRTTIAATALSPVAAVAIVAGAHVLDWMNTTLK